MEDKRPDPNELLKQLSETDPTHRIGKLKIFFGYAAGVGKTYAMLQAAHEAKKAGIDVVAGYIEPHARPQTAALTEGLEALPNFTVKYKDVTLREFDIDAAIARHPGLILVDELAHTNATGCRHLKRYQDIEELLNLGIDVYSTVNVQHIESLNDIVAAITGVIVRERIPDRIFDSADHVELVDIEPDDLLARLDQSKVYEKSQAQRAMGHFFTQENLTSLREIALRRTADRVNKAAEKTKPVSRKSDYFTGEHILICLSSSPTNAKVIRTAARMADAFHGIFTALFVETPGTRELEEVNRNRLRQNLKLAEQLGARISTVYGEDIPYQIAEYAKISGVSKIVIGRSNNKKSLFLRKQSFIDRLTAMAPNLDIYVIPDNAKPYSPPTSKKVRPPVFSIADTIKTLGILSLSTAVGVLFFDLGFSEANIVTAYILGVLVTAFITEGKIYGVVASLVSVLMFNFFFTDPYFTLAAFDPGYPVTFFIMFLASIFTSTLTKRVKQQAQQAAVQGYRTQVLLETSQKLQRAKSAKEIIGETVQQLLKLLQKDIIFYSAEGGELGTPQLFRYDGTKPETQEYLGSDEQAVAHWVYKNNKNAGANTGTLPGARFLYMAVRGKEAVLAVVGIPMKNEDALETFEKSLLIAMLSQCAMALEKEYATKAQSRIAMEARQEQLRSNLLRAISHDLRTPLTSISGNAGLLMSHGGELDSDRRQELYTDIYDDSIWLINLVENLLSVTRINNGTMSLNMQSELLSDVLEEALSHIDRKKGEHDIKVSLSDDLLMAMVDAGLVVQVIINVVDNAIKYTQAGSHIRISAALKKGMVEVHIADDGDGVPDEAKKKLFDMFYTADNQRGDARRGMGLGLSLCKSIVEAHGGKMWVEDNRPKGTVFIFTLQHGEVHKGE